MHTATAFALAEPTAHGHIKDNTRAQATSLPFCRGFILSRCLTSLPYLLLAAVSLISHDCFLGPHMALPLFHTWSYLAPPQPPSILLPARAVHTPSSGVLGIPIPGLADTLNACVQNPADSPECVFRTALPMSPLTILFSMVASVFSLMSSRREENFSGYLCVTSSW